jgi:DNA-binding transcriptional ArsR family regulator
MEILRDDLDSIWQALANRWRRSILDLLRAGPLGTGELVDALGAERHQVLAHLQVLREVGLVTVERQGRRRVNHLNPVPIEQIYTRWVSTYEQSWTQALVGLKRTIEADRPAARRRGGDQVG